MKIYISILMTIAFTFLGIHNTQAQSAAQIQKTEQSIKKKGKYALLVMKTQHLKAAIMTGQGFKATSPKIDFQIVACGELVKEIAADSALQNLISQAVNKDRLKIVICGISIKQFKVDKTTLPAETPVSENGLIYMFGLQEQGYKTIIL